MMQFSKILAQSPWVFCLIGHHSNVSYPFLLGALSPRFSIVKMQVIDNLISFKHK